MSKTVTTRGYDLSVKVQGQGKGTGANVLINLVVVENTDGAMIVKCAMDAQQARDLADQLLEAAEYCEQLGRAARAFTR